MHALRLEKAPIFVLQPNQKAQSDNVPRQYTEIALAQCIKGLERAMTTTQEKHKEAFWIERVAFFLDELSGMI